MKEEKFPIKRILVTPEESSLVMIDTEPCGVGECRPETAPEKFSHKRKPFEPMKFIKEIKENQKMKKHSSYDEKQCNFGEVLASGLVYYVLREFMASVTKTLEPFRLLSPSRLDQKAYFLPECSKCNCKKSRGTFEHTTRQKGRRK